MANYSTRSVISLREREQTNCSAKRTTTKTNATVAGVDGLVSPVIVDAQPRNLFHLVTFDTRQTLHSTGSSVLCRVELTVKDRHTSTRRVQVEDGQVKGEREDKIRINN